MDSQEAKNSSDATAAEADQADNPDEAAAQEANEGQKQGEDPDGVGKMTPEERNNYYAQRRIAEKQVAQEADTEFLGQLRDAVRTEYIEVDPDDVNYDDMDPQVAEQLKRLHQSDRERQAERAIEQIAAVRETTRLGIVTAEASIPMFNQADPAYNKALHERALSGYAHRYLVVQPGPDGAPQVVGTKPGAPSPLEYLQQEAQEFGEILKAERVSGQQVARRNLSIADTGSSNGVTQTNSNSHAAIESRIGDIPLDKF